MALLLVLLAFPFLFHSSQCETFCEKNCLANEVYSKSVSQCHSTCFDQDLNVTSSCEISPGCVCNQGFIRNHNTYKCVPLSSCLDKRFSKQCPDNEFYSDCDAGCQPTCMKRNLAKQDCRCFKGCACRTGFIRSDITYQCIPIAQCESKP